MDIGGHYGQTDTMSLTRLFKANLLSKYVNSIKNEKGAEGSPDCRAK